MNVQLVLAMQQLGGSSSDTECLLAFLGLPNGNIFNKKGFHKIEGWGGKQGQSMSGYSIILSPIQLK